MITRKHATSALRVSFGVAVVLNAIEVFVDPDSWAWWGARAMVSVVFTGSLLLWIGAFLRDRRTRATDPERE